MIGIEYEDMGSGHVVKAAVKKGRPDKGARLRTSADNRESIMDAAEELLVAEGLRGTTTRAVGRRAKVDHTLIYHYFGSLEELLIAVLVRIHEEYLIEENERLSTIPFSLRDYWETRVNVVQEGRPLRRMIAWFELQPLFITRPELQPRLHVMREIVQGLLRGAIERGVESGSIVLPQGVSARGLAALIWVVSDGLGTFELQGEDVRRTDLLPLIDQLIFAPVEGALSKGRAKARP